MAERRRERTQGLLHETGKCPARSTDDDCENRQTNSDCQATYRRVLQALVIGQRGAIRRQQQRARKISAIAPRSNMRSTV